MKPLTVRVIEVNGELCVPIPKSIMKSFGWKVGDKVSVEYDKKCNAVTVKKA